MRVLPLRHAAVLAALLALPACAVGPDWRRPNPYAPPSYAASGSPGTRAGPRQLLAQGSEVVQEPLDPMWWEWFNDPLLAGVVRRVASQNLDVRAAGERLAQSRAQRRIASADLFPQANGNASYTREKQSTRGVLSLIGGGGSSGGSSGSPGTGSNGLGGVQGGIPVSGVTGGSGGGAASAIGSPFDLFQYGFDASWELDIWGRVRRSVESAEAQVESSAEDRRNILLSMMAEAARDYLQLRGAQEQLRVTRENLRTAQENVQLTRSRFTAGLATELDVQNAISQAETTASNMPQLEQQEAKGMNALALLLGQPPGSLRAELGPPRGIPGVPPRVPIGLPSELARRRPDVRQAEAQLHAATAEIGVATADFFPRITLSGSLALQSLQFKDLGNWGARTYSMGPSITLPIFQGGRLRATLELRRRQQQEAAINYQKAVLQAFHDVDNALVAYAAEQRRRDTLTRQAEANRRALDLATSRYRSGLSDFLNVLTAEQGLLQAQQQLAVSTATIGTNLVQLYKALGGGWEGEYPRDEAVVTQAGQP